MRGLSVVLLVAFLCVVVFVVLYFVVAPMSFGYYWDIEKLSPEVWAEYQEKIKKGEVTDW